MSHGWVGAGRERSSTSGDQTRAHIQPVREESNGWVAARDGTRLFVTDHGLGEPILFIPGLGYASWCWLRQVEQISSVARVLTVDNRGAGRSDKPAGPYSIRQLAEDAYAVLAQRSALPAHIVGGSMGGYVALTLALHHPDAVRSLVLLATTSGGPGSYGVPEDTLRAWDAAANLGPAEYARATMPLAFAPGWVEEHPAEYQDWLAHRLSAPTPIMAWRSQFAACASYLRFGLAPGPIIQPAWIIHGTADRVVPYPNAAHLARRLPHASVITLSDAGHLCWIERAAEVNDVITQIVAP
jgi:3-oxoadipate enol-lactonase